VNLQNIIITEEFKLKLADYSCACKLSKKGAQHIGIAGSRGYIAPELYEEVLKGNSSTIYDPVSTDHYSLGVCILKMLGLE